MVHGIATGAVLGGPSSPPRPLRPLLEHIYVYNHTLPTKRLGNVRMWTTHRGRYAEAVTRRRLHQPIVRGQVIQEAAHIIPDSDDNGLPLVSNGLSLCRIHHAAYDRNLLGIRPDSIVQINQALLNEIDGPMLLHGLQEMHGRQLVLPVRGPDRPDPDRLAARYEVFSAS